MHGANSWQRLLPAAASSLMTSNRRFTVLSRGSCFTDMGTSPMHRSLFFLPVQFKKEALHILGLLWRVGESFSVPGCSRVVPTFQIVSWSFLTRCFVRRGVWMAWLGFMTIGIRLCSIEPILRWKCRALFLLHGRIGLASHRCCKKRSWMRLKSMNSERAF